MAVSARGVANAVCLVVVSAAALLVDRIPPFERFFFVDDESIQFPMAKVERIYSMVIPIAIVLLLSALCSRDSRITRHSLMGLLYAIASNGLITHIIKAAVGRLRPDFLDRCKPAAYKTNGYSTCTGDPSIVQDGRKSFPSGHSSASWTGFTYVALLSIALISAYFTGEHNAQNPIKRIQPWKLILVGLLFLPPYMISVSRFQDYRHHWQDVVAGSCIGFATSYLWFMHYIDANEINALFVERTNSRNINAMPARVATSMSDWDDLDVLQRV